MMSIKNEVHFTIKEVADRLKISPQTLYTRIKEKRLPATKLGNKWYIPEHIVRLEAPKIRNFNVQIPVRDLKTDSWLWQKTNIQKLYHWASAQYIDWASFSIIDYVAYFKYLILSSYRQDPTYKIGTPPTLKQIISYGFGGFKRAFDKRYPAQKNRAITTYKSFIEFLRNQKIQKLTPEKQKNINRSY